jgi:hypothetical protein
MFKPVFRIRIRMIRTYIFGIRIRHYLYGSGQGSFYQQAKQIKINHDFYLFVTSM